jgi:UDP-N-acetylmuramoyl-L-alanyl-D-glutamate--2,6-diaminopimelate ligase
MPQGMPRGWPVTPSFPAVRLPDGTWELGPQVRGVTDDSRTVRPGDLFVAIHGSRHDGHRYLEEAWRRGAVGAVVERGAVLPPVEGLPLWAVASTRRALAELADTVYGHPSRRLYVAGVTGTNGKTTVAYLLGRILEATGHPCRVLGTLHAPEEEDPRRYPLTTPFPLDLQRLLRTFADQGVEAVAMEVSSHALVQHRTDQVEFDCAILTTLGRDHLDYHRTLRAYWAAKVRLFKSLSRPRHKAGAPVAVLPVSGPGVAWVARHTRVATVRYGLSLAADVRAQGVRPLTWGSAFQLRAGRSRAYVELSLPGRFNVENALAAAAAAYARGIAVADIAAALSSVQGVPGRAQRMDLAGGGFAVIDYAHNPGGLEAILAAVRHAVGSAPVVCVFGGRGHRDPGKLPLMGETAARYADALVLTADSPLDEDPAQLAQAIRQGVPPHSPVHVEYVPDREEAMVRALALMGPRGCMVVTGRGHESLQWLGDRVERRTDLEMLRSAARRAGRPLLEEASSGQV